MSRTESSSPRFPAGIMYYGTSGHRVAPAVDLFSLWPVGPLIAVKTGDLIAVGV